MVKPRVAFMELAQRSPDVLQLATHKHMDMDVEALCRASYGQRAVPRANSRNDAVVDPNIAQLPPHITLEQAHNLFSAMRKGDPDEGGVIKESIKSVLAGLLPHRAEH